MTSPYRKDLFEGKRLVITGGGTGLGRAFATTLCSLGADAFLISRNPDHLDTAATAIASQTGQRVTWKAADVRDPAKINEAVEAAAQHLGGIDILVNAAAGNFVVPSETMSPNAWKSVVDIVLTGTFHTTQAAFEHLKASRGCVVNVLANYAWGAAPFVAHSGAAKAGVLNLTRSLALEWAPHGIRVNAVTPGMVPTDGAKGNLFPTPEMEAAAIETIPAGRVGSAQEIANAVAFLASDAAAYMTGENVVVDGGQWLAGNAFFELGRRFGPPSPPK